MNLRELEILEQIEKGVSTEDAAFAERMASGPRFSGRYLLGSAAISLAGIALVMMFPANLLFGVVGYLVLVAVGTNALRRRPIRPIDESPLQFFHRLTAGMFVSTETTVESALD